MRTFFHISFTQKYFRITMFSRILQELNNFYYNSSFLNWHNIPQSQPKNLSMIQVICAGNVKFGGNTQKKHEFYLQSPNNKSLSRRMNVINLLMKYFCGHRYILYWHIVTKYIIWMYLIINILNLIVKIIKLPN